MDVRSGFALKLQLKHVAGHAVDSKVKDALAAVVKHMTSGRSSYRGGRVLISLLKDVRSTAAAVDEWQVVRLIQDSLDFTEGRILRPDFEERYRLFQRSTEPLSSHQDYLARTLSASLAYFMQLGCQYLQQHPGASPNEMLTHVEAIARDARYMQQSQELPGRYRILRGSAEVAAWLEQVFQERVDVEDPEENARRIVMSPDSLAVLAADREGQLLLRAAEVQRRRRGLKALRMAVEDPKANERDLQRALDGQYWIFGGQFASQAIQRRLVPGD